jgi:hypothetical protein
VFKGLITGNLQAFNFAIKYIEEDYELQIEPDSEEDEALETK